MACCVVMAAVFAAVLGLKARLFGKSTGEAQAWRLEKEER